MSDTVSNIQIKIGSTGDFAAFNAARAQAEALRASVGGLKDVLGTFGVGLSAGALLELGKGAVETMASIKRLSEQAGISASAFQTLSLVAIDAGMDQASLATSLERLRKSMAEAEAGAGAQNKAIRELGLNTADLLAMPAELQVEAIAKAYLQATDKGRAWADVIALLGRNSANFQQVLEKIGTEGFAAADAANSRWKISDADLANAERMEHAFSSLGPKTEAMAVQLADWVRSLNTASKLLVGIQQVGAVAGFNDAPTKRPSSEAPPGATIRSFTAGMEADAKSGKNDPAAAKAASTAKADAIRAEMSATLQALPAMIEAHAALTKALEDESAAYQTNGEKAARLRGEAAQDEAKSKTDAADPADFVMMTQSVKDQTEASKLRGEANKLDATTQKELSALAEKAAIFDGKGVSESQQLVMNRATLLVTQTRLAALDPASVSYADEKLSLGKEELRLKEAIRVEEEKTGQAERKRPTGDLLAV